MSGQNGIISEVENDNTGMRPPPTDLSWPPPPSPTQLSAGAAAFIPTSNLLGQARSVLYPQKSGKMQYYQYMPPSYEQNNNYTMMQGDVNFAHSLDYQNQPSVQVSRPFTTTTINTTTTASSVISTGAARDDKSYTSYTTNGIKTGFIQVLPESQPPPWASQMLQRLKQIESHLSSQTTKWQDVETSLQNLNVRMSSTEIQVKELTQRDISKIWQT